MDELGETIRAHLPVLRKYALTLTRAPDAADDLVQDAVCRALVYRETYVAGTRPLAWLVRILRNTFYTERYQASRRRLFEANVAVISPKACLPEQEIAVEASELSSVFERVPPAFMAAYERVRLDGDSCVSAAEALMIPVATVKTRAHRAHRIIARAVAERAVCVAGLYKRRTRKHNH